MKLYQLLTLLCFSTSLSLHAQQIQGTWVGTVKLDDTEPPQVAFEISQEGNQRLQILMHIINQKMFNLKTENARITGKQLNIDIPAMSTHFEGRLVNDSTITGILIMNDQRKFPLELTRQQGMKIAKTKRPQEPVPPLPYRSEDVVFRQQKAGISLAGTLTLPATGNRFPAVVLISGSGPNDRDETIFTHKVFLVLADYLTRSGIAVLRVDDRGVGKSTGNFDTATNEDLADDALAGVNYLSTRNEIDPRSIGLIGHSLGADIAPIAALSGPVAHIVLMSGSAAPIENCYYESMEALGKLLGATPHAIAVNNKVLATVFKIAKEEPDVSISQKRLADSLLILDKEVALLSDKDREIMELPQPLSTEDFLPFLSGPRRADFFRNQYDILRKVKCPVLAINGSKDIQVLPKQLKNIQQALQAGGNKQVTIKLFEGKNHLFQTCKTGSHLEYENIEETIAPDVLTFMTAWIKQQHKMLHGKSSMIP